MPFYAVVSAASEHSAAVMFRAADLKEYADLRNAIVHFGPPFRAIAEPHQDAVLAIEQLRNTVLQPPKVIADFKRRVHVCLPGEPIAGVIQRMRSGSFSQMPVVEKDKIAALLTTNTIVRWLATRAKDAGRALEEENVAAVLREAEVSDNYHVLSRSSTVFDALRVFEQRMDNGPPLDALLVTPTGTSHGTPEAILTSWDHPRLSAMARGLR